MKRLLLALALLCGGQAILPVLGAENTDRQDCLSSTCIGRRIYASGEGRHPITASVGGSELPATMLPCANCHGADGRGKAEGGVVPSNVTWLELTKPYRAAAPNGRRRPAYTEETFRRAVAEGVDSAGNPLHPAMPRYAMAPEDVSDLISYLKVLGHEQVPGVTDATVRIGTLVPKTDAGAQMAAVLSAYFQDAGEIHGRRVVLETIGGTPASPPAEQAASRRPVFALAAGLTDAAAEDAVEQAGIPLVLPVSVRRTAAGENQQRFYLSPAVDEQVEGLLKFTGTTRETATVFLDPDAKLAGTPVEGDRKLLFLGSLLPSDFFQEAPKYGGRIRVALTTTPADLTAEGIAEYRAFAARHSITGTNAAAQLSAYAAAKVVVQALRASGRELTRDVFRNSIESLYEFHTGVTPPLTFGRSRRIGAPRVYVATVDARGNLTPAGTFTIP